MPKVTRVTQYRGVEDTTEIVEVRKYKESRQVRCFRCDIRRRAFSPDIKWEPIKFEEVQRRLEANEIVPL